MLISVIYISPVERVRRSFALDLTALAIVVDGLYVVFFIVVLVSVELVITWIFDCLETIDLSIVLYISLSVHSCPVSQQLAHPRLGVVLQTPIRETLSKSNNCVV